VKISFCQAKYRLIQHRHAYICAPLKTRCFSDGGLIDHFADDGDGTWRLIANTEVEPYAPSSSTSWG
jgi:hypothetical protein